MHVTAHLDVDVVAVETDDDVSVLLELTAPPAEPTSAARPPATLQVVLDRSGSMQEDDRLEGAKIALLALVDRLEPTDNFGLVAFDDQASVVVPAGPLTDKDAVRSAISQIELGGMTDLSSGYLRGLQEARRVCGPTGATVLLISDGHANQGVTDHDQLRRSPARRTATESPPPPWATASATTSCCSVRSPTAAPVRRCSPRTPTPPASRWRARSTGCWPSRRRPRTC